MNKTQLVSNTQLLAQDLLCVANSKCRNMFNLLGLLACYFLFTYVVMVTKM